MIPARLPPIAIAVACGLLQACATDGPTPGTGRLTGTSDTTETVRTAPDLGLNIPKTLDGFSRVDTELRGHGADVVAGYARTIDPAPVYATIRLRRNASEGLRPLFPSGGSETSLAASGLDLESSIAQIRRFYPRARILGERDIYLLRFGVVQRGRSATLEFTDILDGTRQPIRLDVYDFCCQRGEWSYEYRFRYPAALAARPVLFPFVRDLPWSPDPANSIDRPEQQ